MESEQARVILRARDPGNGSVYSGPLTGPRQFPVLRPIIPGQAARRREIENLYETTEGILRKGDPGFEKVLKTIHRNVDETSLALRANRILCSGTHGAGTVIELQHSKGKRSSTDKYRIGSSEKVRNWLEAETNRPIKWFRTGLGVLAIGLQIDAVLV